MELIPAYGPLQVKVQVIFPSAPVGSRVVVAEPLAAAGLKVTNGSAPLQSTSAAVTFTVARGDPVSGLTVRCPEHRPPIPHCCTQISPGTVLFAQPGHDEKVSVQLAPPSNEYDAVIPSVVDTVGPEASV